jgi:hypothetical protein
MTQISRIVPRPAALVADRFSEIQDGYLRERSTHSHVEALKRALSHVLGPDDSETVCAFIAGDLDDRYATADEPAPSGRELGAFLREKLEELYQEVVSTEQQAERWRRLNTMGLALDFTRNPLLLGQFGRALQAGDADAQQRVVSQAVDAIVEKAHAEERTQKRRRVALQCAAGFLKAQAHEIAEGEDFTSAMQRLQASDRYEDALCMLWCQTVLMALARVIMQLGR